MLPIPAISVMPRACLNVIAIVIIVLWSVPGVVRALTRMLGSTQKRWGDCCSPGTRRHGWPAS
jgi:hypothetical protein